MGDTVKRAVKATATLGLSEVDKSGVLRTGKTSAKKAQKEQSLLINKQRQVDELNLAETESELARKRSLAKSPGKGRSSLIKTSATGVKSNNLGGTV